MTGESIYPYKALAPKISEFIKKYESRMEKEGWLIIDTDSKCYYQRYSSDGTFFRVGRNDKVDILENDNQAYELADALGLMIGLHGEILAVPEIEEQHTVYYIIGGNAVPTYRKHGFDEYYRQEIREGLSCKSYPTKVECKAFLDALQTYEEEFVSIRKQDYDLLMQKTEEEKVCEQRKENDLLAKSVIEKIHSDVKAEKSDAIDKLVEQLVITTNPQQVLKEYLGK